MNFDSALFFAILAVSVVLTALSAAQMRVGLLLAISLIFYGTWDWRFLPLVALIAGLAWAFGIAIGRSSGPARDRMLVWAVVLLAAPLALFKYTDFALDNLGTVLGLSLPAFGWILPIGISFFTFHAISYVVDIRDRKLDAGHGFSQVALYISFFPHMIAGPIVRPGDFFPYVDEHWELPSSREVAFLVTRFLWGLFKKLFIADRLATSIVDPVFSQPELASPQLLVMAALSFGMLIYADFSGYSDMAISSARLMGIRFRENFLSPYTATSIGDFWRRWHVSLSSWIRDYVYIPLGGNRSGRARTLLNLMMAMTLCGLWHGASWAFVLWGALHGAGLVAERILFSRLPDNAAVKVLGWGATTVVVYVGWILFRAADLDLFARFMTAMATSQQPNNVPPALISFLAVAGAVVYVEQFMLRRCSALPRLLGSVGAQVGIAAALSCFLLLVYRSDMGARNFIYFQF